MRIGIFSESYMPIRNGVMVSVTTLSDELTRLGHQVYIFAPGYKGYRDAGENVIRFPSFRTIMEPGYPIPIPFLPGLMKKVRSLHLDVIHTQTPWALGWLGLRMARRLGIPIISTNHTQYAEYAHYFTLAPASVTKAAIIWIMKRYYNRCDAIVTPSRQVSEMLEKYGVRRPLHVIPTGISISTLKNEAGGADVRRRYGIPEDARVLVYAGRLAKEKNLSLLFDAFEILAPEYSRLWLMVVGNGPSEPECKRIAGRSTHSNRIVLTGSVPRDEIVNYYSAGSVFLFPSLTDTQGLVLCEALQAGLPCVAVRAGGSPEMISEGEDGFLTENDAVDFTAKIRPLLDDPGTVNRCSVKAVQNSMRFTSYGMASQMLNVYESAMRDSCLDPCLTVRPPV